MSERKILGSSGRDECLPPCSHRPGAPVTSKLASHTSMSHEQIQTVGSHLSSVSMMPRFCDTKPCSERQFFEALMELLDLVSCQALCLRRPLSPAWPFGPHTFPYTSQWALSSAGPCISKARHGLGSCSSICELAAPVTNGTSPCPTVWHTQPGLQRDFPDWC